MITVDERKCIGCGRCMPFCPREAITVWGVVRVDTGKCTDCFGEVYHFDEDARLTETQSILDKSRFCWTRLCIENCPVNALNTTEK